MILGFGKYRGKSVGEVMREDAAYIGWCLEQGLLSELDKETRQRARRAKDDEDLNISNWALVNGYF